MNFEHNKYAPIPDGRHIARQILCYKYVYISSVVCLYWIVSIVTVFVNKTLLSGPSVDLDAPIFIVWFQCFISVLICLGVKGLSAVCPAITFPEGSPFKRQSAVKVFPLSLLFTSMIVFNNLCLKHTSVAFYFIGRSLTTVFNVLFTFVILKERVSARAIVCCFLIVFGFMLGIDQEHLSGTFSLFGTFSGLVGSLSLALSSIFTKKVLPAVGNHIFLLSYFNNVYSCIVLLPIILLNGEFSVLFNYEKLSDSDFWLLLTLGGLCGFSIGYVTSLQIQATSPLTHNVSGTAKACAQTVIASFYYNDVKTFLWWVSNAIVLGASAAYTAVRQREMKDKLQRGVC